MPLFLTSSEPTFGIRGPGPPITITRCMVWGSRGRGWGEMSRGMLRGHNLLSPIAALASPFHPPGLIPPVHLASPLSLRMPLSFCPSACILQTIIHWNRLRNPIKALGE